MKSDTSCHVQAMFLNNEKRKGYRIGDTIKRKEKVDVKKRSVVLRGLRGFNFCSDHFRIVYKAVIYGSIGELVLQMPS